MKVFKISKSKLTYHLSARNLSYQNIADQLYLNYRPTKRTIDEIKKGRVPARWRKAVADLVGVPGAELYSKGKIKPSYLSKVSESPIQNIRIAHRLTKASIAGWLNDDEGGIEPEHLDALAGFLQTRPIDLISPDTVLWMREFLDGGKASN